MTLLPPGKQVGANKQEYLFNECPGCGKRDKFYWNTHKEVGFCHSCEIKITGTDALERRCGNLTETILRKSRYTDSVRTVPSMLLAASLWDPSLNYLKKRSVSLENILLADIRACEEERRIYIPIQPMSPEYQLSWMHRSIQDKGFWMVQPGTRKAHYAFGHQWIPDSRRVCVLVEGMFDLLSPDLIGYGIALLGKQLSVTHIAYLKMHFEKAYLWLDADAPGRNALPDMQLALEAEGLEVRCIRSKHDPDMYAPTHPLVIRLKWRIYNGF